DYSRIYADDPAFSMDSHRDGIFNTMYGQMSASTPVIPKYEAPMEAYNVYGNFTSGNFSGNLYHAFFKIPNSWENNTSHAVFNKDVYMAQTVTMASMTYKKQLGKVTSTSIFNA